MCGPSRLLTHTGSFCQTRTSSANLPLLGRASPTEPLKEWYCQ